MVMAGCITSLAQVTGTVVDSNDDPLPGVTVLVKGTNSGVSTNLDGHYSIDAPSSATLIFRYIGMEQQEIKVNGRKVIDVVMKESADAAALDEVVVVGYGQQKRGTITGAVSTVSGKELLTAPTMSISNIVGSRVAGVASVQSSGQPGSDVASLTIRGQGVIYVIDGIKRSQSDFNQLDPNDVESISILKDASAIAVYGLDASGVFIVTTKKGSAGKSRISYSGTVGWSENAEEQNWLDGPGYAFWQNKANELNGLQPKFTEAHVANMLAGTNGWGNTNWYKEMFGHKGIRTAHNLSASGGNERYQYFASLGYLKEDGNVKNYDFERFNLRSNIDAEIIEGLHLSLGIAGRLERRNQPYWSASPDDYLNVGQQMVRMLPYVPMMMDYDNNQYWVATRSASSYSNPIQSISDSGYNNSDYYFFNSNLSLQYDFKGLLKGLYVKFTGSYDVNFYFQKQLCLPRKVMLAGTPSPDSETLPYTLSDQYTNMNTQLVENNQRQYFTTTQSFVGYHNRFGLHDVNALFVAETRQWGGSSLGGVGYGLYFPSLDNMSNITNTNAAGGTQGSSISGASSMARTVGFVGRVNYAFDDRYFLEASIRRDGSYLFGGMNKRWINLPGISLGWRIDREKFFSADWVQNLKLRFGYGKTATSQVSPYMWNNQMGQSANAVMVNGVPSTIIYASVLANPNLRWSNCDNYNVGVDATFWHGLLGVELDVFYKYNHDLLSGVVGSWPESMGGYYYSAANVNSTDYKGFDLTLTHQNRIGNVNYGAKLIWSFTYGRWLHYAGDSNEAPEYQRVTGKAIGARPGFTSLGLFQSEAEIAASPVTPQAVLPGYIKYLDRNGDGAVTWDADWAYVGKGSTPRHTGSLDLFGNWKGFDIDLLWSWGLGHDVALTGQYTAYGSEGVMDHTAYTKPFYHGGNSPVYLVENSWTPDNTGAYFPRLENGVNSVSNNNGYSSTHWYKNGDYLRLKTAQIGYTFPEKWLAKSGITRLRIYAEGYNLLTFSGLKKYNIDPEAPAVNNGYYPQQRKYSFGINLSF